MVTFATSASLKEGGGLEQTLWGNLHSLTHRPVRLLLFAWFWFWLRFWRCLLAHLHLAPLSVG